MSWEKSIADKLIGMFGKAKQEVETLETKVVNAEKDIFEKAHEDAIAANSAVNKIKEDLQEALAKAAKIHQEAIDAANAAKAAAEAEVARFKALADAHSRDLATQTAVQTIAPVVLEPVQPQTTDATTPADSTAPVVRENPQVLLAQAQQQQ
jgi:hypothetical protein